MITSKKFSSLIKKFSMESVREDLTNMLAFVLYHAVVHANTDPAKRLSAAAGDMPRWVGDIVAGFSITSKDAKAVTNEEEAESVAFKYVMLKLVAKNEADIKRREQAAARKAKKEQEQAAPAQLGSPADVGASVGAPAPAPEHSYWLYADEEIQISAEEAAHLKEVLFAMRAGAAKVVNG